MVGELLEDHNAGFLLKDTQTSADARVLPLTRTLRIKNIYKTKKPVEKALREAIAASKK